MAHTAGISGGCSNCTGIQQNRHRLIGLNVRQTGLNATGADQIAAALAGSKLLHLDLSGNSDVRDEGAQVIGWALSKHRESQAEGARSVRLWID